MAKLWFLLAITFSLGISAQDNELDARYLEDQFYVGLSYNFLRNIPEGSSLRNLSYGLQGGFIKDIPINSKRNFGFGLGLGYAVNAYYSNIGATEVENGISYSIIDSDVNLKRSKFESHLIEMPIQLRWRSSNAEEYKFWRIYAGVKLGYVFGSRYKYVTDALKISFNNINAQSFQYGLTFNFGYNTFNIHAYYALSSLYKSGTNLTNGEILNVKPLRIGLIFYIL